MDTPLSFYECDMRKHILQFLKNGVWENKGCLVHKGKDSQFSSMSRHCLPATNPLIAMLTVRFRGPMASPVPFLIARGMLIQLGDRKIMWLTWPITTKLSQFNQVVTDTATLYSIFRDHNVLNLCITLGQGLQLHGGYHNSSRNQKQYGVIKMNHFQYCREFHPWWGL